MVKKVDRRRTYYIVIDSETSNKRRVVDFAAVICDRKGTIYNQCAILIGEVFHNEELFNGGSTGFFAAKNLEGRKENYLNMVENGQRLLGTVPAINRWLSLANKTYSPIATAYNWIFDEKVCENTGIDISIFDSNFCLWRESAHTFARTKKYLRFCLEHRYLTPKMNFLTNAEVMAHYLVGNDIPEPHTALEDILDYEIPVLVKWLKQKKGIKNIPYSWRNYQLKDLVSVGGKDVEVRG